MKRREFMTLLGGAAVAWPLAARAQQQDRFRKIGILMPYHEHDAEIQARIAVFRQELRKLGWREGDNLRIDERWSADNMGRIGDHAVELVSLNPDLILVSGRRAVPIVQQQTRSIPVLFVGISDPVASGLVETLARPGGNLTGFSQIEFSLIEKLVELLRELAPGITRVAFISNPDNPATALYSRSFKAVTNSFAMPSVIFPVHEPAEIEQAIEAFAREPNGGVVFPPDLTILDSPQTRRDAGGQISPASDLHQSGIRRGRWPDVLRSRGARPVPTRCVVRRPHSSRREAERAAGSAADQV